MAINTVADIGVHFYDTHQVIHTLETFDLLHVNS